MPNSNVPNGIGPINASFVGSLLQAKKSEYAFQEEHKLSTVPSQYAVACLENVVMLNSNPVYQQEPMPVIPRHVVPGSGVPISASVLKQKIAALEDKIYVPTILDGALYFVSADDDARTARGEQQDVQTAREVSSQTRTAVESEEPVFTVGQLTEIFGQEIATKLARVKKGEPLPDGLRQVLVTLKKSSQGGQATPSGSLEQLTTPLASQWNTPTKNVDTAMSRTMLTGVDTLSDRTAVSCTMLTGTEKTDETRTARSDSETALAQALDSTTGIPPYLLLTTPTTDPHAARAVSSIDTMTALEAK